MKYDTTEKLKSDMKRVKEEEKQLIEYLSDHHHYVYDGTGDTQGQLSGSPDYWITTSGAPFCGEIVGVELKTDMHTTGNAYIEAMGGRGRCSWKTTTAEYGMLYFPGYDNPRLFLIPTTTIRSWIDEERGIETSPGDGPGKGYLISHSYLRSDENVFEFNDETGAWLR